MLGVKSQDTAGVLNDLRAAGVTDQPIVCMQNGVENERQALRLFPNVYGMCVMLPADHLAPGVVRVWTAPSSGLLDVGRYPHGVDDLSVQLAATLEAATFGSIPRDDIMSWKYRKLLMNLGNAVEAVCGRDGFGGRLGEMVQAEGEAVLAAAGITVVSAEDDLARRGDALKIQPVGDEPAPRRRIVVAEPAPRHRHDRNRPPHRRDRAARPTPRRARPRPTARCRTSPPTWPAPANRRPRAPSTTCSSRSTPPDRRTRRSASPHPSSG